MQLDPPDIPACVAQLRDAATRVESTPHPIAGIAKSTAKSIRKIADKIERGDPWPAKAPQIWSELEFVRLNFPSPAVIHALESAARFITPRDKPFVPKTVDHETFLRHLRTRIFLDRAKRLGPEGVWKSLDPAARDFVMRAMARRKRKPVDK